jgi:uncharacterized protein with GYD domain
MPTFVVLGKLTSQAKQNGPTALQHRDKLFAEFRKKGFTLTDYMTLGPYDVVVIVEAPSDEQMMQFLMASGATGNLDTVTLKAFPAASAPRPPSS